MSLSEPTTAAEIVSRARGARRRLFGARPRIDRPAPVWPVGKFRLPVVVPLPKAPPPPSYRLCKWLTCPPFAVDLESRLDPAMPIPRVSLHEIIKAVCLYCDVKLEEFFGDRRHTRLVVARAVVAYLACDLTNLSMPKIGRLMGGFDHTTPLHHRDSVRAILERETAGERLSAKDRIKCAAVATVRAQLLGGM